MSDYSAGTVTWARDPTGAHDQRPVVVLSHEHHPFSATECTVMCLGTNASKYDHPTPELTDQHVSGISFSEPTHLMPWALRTILPGAISTGTPGHLTEEGRKLVKRELIKLFSL